jgi:uncharacterized membrane protein
VATLRTGRKAEVTSDEPSAGGIAVRRWAAPMRAAVLRRATSVPEAAWPVLIGIGLFVFLAATALRRQMTGAAGPDTAYFVQALDLISEGRSPFLSFYGIHLLGDHSNFFLWALAPLAVVFPVVPVLLVTQAAAGAVAVWPLWLVLRRRFGLSAGLSVSLLVAYAVHPALQNANLADFHLDLFAVPFLAGAVYFGLDPGRVSPWYWACVAGALTTREEVAVSVVVLGGVLALRHRRVGLATVAAALVWALVQYALVKPSFAGGAELARGRIEQYGGDSLPEAIAAWIRHPTVYGSRLVGEDTVKLALMYLTPLAFLPLLRMRWILPGLVLQGVYLLSGQPWPRLGTGHYGATLVPFLVIAAGAALAARRLEASPALLGRLVLAGAAFAWAAFSLAGPFGLRHVFVSSPLEEARVEAAGHVPDGVAVGASQAMAALVAHRTEVYSWPRPWEGSVFAGDPVPRAERQAQVDWLLLDTAATAQWSEDMVAAVGRIVPAEGFVVVWEGEGVQVYRRVRS